MNRRECPVCRKWEYELEASIKILTTTRIERDEARRDSAHKDARIRYLERVLEGRGTVPR